MSPSTAAAAAPAMAAPIVWAIVFNVSIAVIGCWISSLSFFRTLPERRPDLDNISTWLIDTE